jgi:hypothetical protein
MKISAARDSLKKIYGFVFLNFNLNYKLELI